MRTVHDSPSINIRIQGLKIAPPLHLQVSFSAAIVWLGKGPCGMGRLSKGRQLTLTLCTQRLFSAFLLQDLCPPRFVILTPKMIPSPYPPPLFKVCLLTPEKSLVGGFHTSLKLCFDLSRHGAIPPIIHRWTEPVEKALRGENHCLYFISVDPSWYEWI